MDRKQRLRDLMARHTLTAPEVADLLSVSPKSVWNWRSYGHRSAIPVTKLELLELKLELRARQAAEGVTHE